MRRSLIAAVAAALVIAAGAHAHLPNSDGGPAKKSCGVLSNVSAYGPVGVGSSGVKCGTAKRIAKRGVRKIKVSNKWRCTGKGTRFGHCHNKRNNKRIVHWNAAH